VWLRLKVVPGASRDEVVGLHGDRLRVRVAAAAEGGRANKAVEALVAGRLGLPAASVRVLHGAASPLKTVRIVGRAGEAVARALGVPPP